MIRAALNKNQLHPEIVLRWDAYLWSLNDCARRLLGQGGIEAGLPIPPLELEFLADLVRVCRDEYEEWQELEAESERRCRE